jgi:hypothetical protein
MDQVYPADRESELLSTQSCFRLRNFATKRDGSINAFDLDPALPSPRITVQRAPYASREGKVGEGGRDGGTDNRFHPFVSFLFMQMWSLSASNHRARNC